MTDMKEFVYQTARTLPVLLLLDRQAEDGSQR